MRSDPVFFIAATVVLAWVLTGLATWYAMRAGLLDHVGARHSHRDPTPRGGGAGLVLALGLTTLGLAAGQMPGYWAACIAPCAATLAIIGWWDDHRSLAAGPRFLVQLAVSLLLLWCGSRGGWLPGWMNGALVMVLAGLFLLWMTNLYNFMDGSNGMAGLQGTFAGCVLAWLFAQAGDAPSTLLALCLAAACAGFLPWNLGRPRVFMGDVGSLFLGFSIGALLVYGVGSGAIAPPAAWLVMLLFLIDATLTLAARVMRGERWYNAHRQHLYQRLIAHGWSHGRVAALYQVINLALVLPGIGVAVLFPALAWPSAIGLTLFFGLGWYLMTRKFAVLAEAG